MKHTEFKAGRKTLILKRHGRHFDTGPPFEDLVRALIRRRHDLVETFVDGGTATREALKLDGSELLLHARGVATREVKTFWQHHRRRSFRSREDQSQSGLLGKIVYRDVPGLLVPLLQLGTLIHVGGGTSMGMGAYTLTVNGDAWKPPFWRDVSRGVE